METISVENQAGHHPKINSEPDLESPLNSDEIGRIKNILDKIRSSVNQLPADSGADVTSLLATVEGHLAAAPPNAVATREAFALIRDQINSTDSPLALNLIAQLDPVLQMLGEPKSLTA